MLSGCVWQVGGWGLEGVWVVRGGSWVPGGGGGSV